MYESHITTECEKDEFINICNNNKLKSVIIANDTGSHLKNQQMTASFHKVKTYQEAYDQMISISKLFSDVIRMKLEKIVGKNTVIDFKYKYKEFHSKFKINKSQEIEFLDIIKKGFGNTSINLIKGDNFRFCTTRNEDLHNKTLPLLMDKFEYLGTIREVVVYDDNEFIDSNYICKDCPLKKYAI